ncbi:YhjD/YihY/BrkB family envelope integrity protein [Granulicoccus phenolivorans]|uniref:YhjD/YihY/BrkB family envelope integrity protein n=1 Tax=Granulicoccus phenolivorans TaxID=266854 RepID=UPI00041157C4|nr:YhjD/YihY/BrkB family envelope integrity protein [Granulicoccus phenolivorans]
MALSDTVKALKAKPAIAHILRMLARYGNRLGNQFAGAITYFSVLALVPILMFAFALLGMTVTVFMPSGLDRIMQIVGEQLAGMPARDSILQVIQDALNNWAGIGIVGLLSAGYSGAGWISNLKSAVRTQLALDLEEKEPKSNIVVETLKNFGSLLVLLLMFVLMAALSNVATTLRGILVNTFHLDGVPGAELGLRLLPMLATLITAWLLFVFLFRVLPTAEQRPTTKVLGWGALIGAVGMVALQYLAGLLMSSFSGNPAAALFGPVIVIMLLFNLLFRLILYVAAWIATANQPAIARRWSEPDEPLRDVPGVRTAPNHWALAEVDRMEQEREKAESQLKRAEMLDKVKGAVPGLHPDPEAHPDPDEVPTPDDPAGVERIVKASEADDRALTPADLKPYRHNGGDPAGRAAAGGRAKQGTAEEATNPRTIVDAD